jgi:hypothetical protein
MIRRDSKRGIACGTCWLNKTLHAVRIGRQPSQIRQPDIYGNIVIGNFLFGSGAAMGWRRREAPAPPTSVSLLQQTPRDKTLGDLLVENARLIRLIEFKRKTNLLGLKKERGKRKQLASGLQSDNWTNLQPVARNVHWFGESDFSPEWYRIVPYPDFADPSVTSRFENLAEFVEAIAREAFGNLTNEEKAAQERSEAQNYLNCCSQFGEAKGAALHQVRCASRLRPRATCST